MNEYNKSDDEIVDEIVGCFAEGTSYHRGQLRSIIAHLRQSKDLEIQDVSGKLDIVRVGMLRQWINEDRIINNPRQTLISNQDIISWLYPYGKESM